MHSAFERNELTGFRKFMKEKTDYLDSLEETVTVSSDDWFSNNSFAENGYLSQIDFAMPNYNSVLTLLWDKQV